MPRTKWSNLLPVIVVYVWTTNVMGSPLPKNQGFHAGYARTTSDPTEANVHASVFGEHSINEKVENEQQLLFANPGVNLGWRSDSGKVWYQVPNAYLHVGVYRTTGKANDVFGNNTANSNYAIDFLTAGAEVGYGAMARARITDAAVSVGPGELNLGVGFDTGVIVTDGVEVKWLGIGGGLSRRGIQACFIVCLGFNWA